MAKGGKAKKMRGSMTHGRGRKAGRGAGLKGGRGRAGANKHRFLQLQVLGGKHAHLAAKPFGRVGFTSKSRTLPDVTINVGDLAARFPGESDLSLTAAGYTKLLGSGAVTDAVTVSVAKATETAIEKIKAAGGTVVLDAAGEAGA
jgi:large subunit ribosomal protein L15